MCLKAWCEMVHVPGTEKPSYMFLISACLLSVAPQSSRSSGERRHCPASQSITLKTHNCSWFDLSESLPSQFLPHPAASNSFKSGFTSVRSDFFGISFSSKAASLYPAFAALPFSPLAVHRNHWCLCCAVFHSPLSLEEWKYPGRLE